MVGPKLKLKNYGKKKPFWTLKNGEVVLQIELLRSNSRLGSLIILSGTVHTGVKVHEMNSDLCRLLEQSWLQLMCCAICLLHGCNFR